jgi:hypothetical protein
VFGLLCCLVATLSFVTAGVLRLMALGYPRLEWRSRRLARFGLVPVLLLVPCAIGLYWRNRTLHALKAFLQERTVALRAFQLSHGELTDDEVVKAFHRTDPGPWIFRFDDQHTYVKVYPTRVSCGVAFAVNFGGRGADVAVFDPDTMLVINSY